VINYQLKIEFYKTLYNVSNTATKKIIHKINNYFVNQESTFNISIILQNFEKEILK